MEKTVMKLCITAIYLLSLLSDQGVEAQALIFDITKYGAKEGGRSNIKTALLSAWEEACNATIPSIVVIPAGVYFLTEVSIVGPCKAPVELQVDGMLNAPADPRAFEGDSWITMMYIDHLRLTGNGTLNGRGGIAWKQNDCNKNPNCRGLPANLRLNFISNSTVELITSLDSKNLHIGLTGCSNLTIQHVNISAPGTSVNTDGIHIGLSTNITVTHSKIGTGDDCVSIGVGSQQINIERVRCGPGHGFSIGSLGGGANESAVSGIWIRHCTLINTTNGVRVKTWPSSPTFSIASNLHFQYVRMINVSNPVLIDQEYCPSNHCSKKSPSLVKISNVNFNHIWGTSASQVAVKLLCSSSTPCEDVKVGYINLKYNGNEGSASSYCANVEPRFYQTQNPPVCSAERPLN